WNETSLFMYISSFKCMLEGIVFKRSINSYAKKYFYDNILIDYGKEAAILAKESIRLHEVYKQKGKQITFFFFVYRPLFDRRWVESKLRGLADEAKGRIGSGVVAFIAVNDGKAAVLTAVTDDLTADISAVELVRVGAAAVGGKGGGGRPDMAQAGGPNGAKANDAIKAIESAIA
ncbi:MAG: hypothetical protein HN572_02070, partial [Kordiimonadaceae bacterium]|nr:hypothetical protein [Kordiimonadaceae bacterium]